eukprot:933686_1
MTSDSHKVHITSYSESQFPLSVPGLARCIGTVRDFSVRRNIQLHTADSMKPSILLLCFSILMLGSNTGVNAILPLLALGAAGALAHNANLVRKKGRARRARDDWKQKLNMCEMQYGLPANASPYSLNCHRIPGAHIDRDIFNGKKPKSEIRYYDKYARCYKEQYQKCLTSQNPGGIGGMAMRGGMMGGMGGMPGMGGMMGGMGGMPGMGGMMGGMGGMMGGMGGMMPG